jgi:hypothetical protein
MMGLVQDQRGSGPELTEDVTKAGRIGLLGEEAV